MSFSGAMAVAMTIETIAGWPKPLYARIGHPVTWLGRLIAALDGKWNLDADSAARRRALGIVASVLVIFIAAALATIVQTALPPGWPRVLIIGLIAWPFVALRSMYDHVLAVADPLAAGDLISARTAVSMIVGRDPSQLDASGVARAAIESLAENTSDGIVAPIFWGVLFGLPGIVGYKAVNTLDSMIGHRTERHEAFGWAAARIDDVANFVPARITGVLFAIASDRPGKSFRCLMRDAHRHRSPNAGWPESAMAGGIGVRISGPRVYDNRIVDEPWLNGEARDATAPDIATALKVYVRAMLVAGAALVAVALL